MTEASHVLDVERVRQLFDLRANYNALFGGTYEEDPYPLWADLRRQAAVHPGIVHELTGFDGPAFFHGLPFPDRPHFSAFSYAACDAIYRDDNIFSSSPEAIELSTDEVGPLNSILSM